MPPPTEASVPGSSALPTLASSITLTSRTMKSPTPEKKRSTKSLAAGGQSQLAVKAQAVARGGTHELRSSFSQPWPAQLLVLPASVVLPQLQTQHSFPLTVTPLTEIGRAHV